MPGTTSCTWTLDGAIVGDIWQPDAGPCGMPVHERFSKAGAPFVWEVETLRDGIDFILMHRGGDFRSARISGDATLTVTRRNYRPGDYTYPVYTESVRTYPVTAFPSIADMIDESLYASDFE